VTPEITAQSISNCETFYTADYTSYNASKTYVAYYEDCAGNTESRTYSP